MNPKFQRISKAKIMVSIGNFRFQWALVMEIRHFQRKKYLEGGLLWKKGLEVSNRKALEKLIGNGVSKGF